MKTIDKILTSGKTLLLAYDQGFEHGAADFTDSNVNPETICDIANKGKFNALIVHKGIAEKYRNLIKIPLIIKLNGKTNIRNEEPLSTQVCSVSEAVVLEAVGVGYTIYLGSEHEQKMFQEFSKIEEEAHSAGLIVIAWIYPRGKAIGTMSPREMLAYAARIGLELGADFIKLPFMGTEMDMAWAVKVAGRARVVFAGGQKKDEGTFLKNIAEVVASGASGLAIGRNIWQARQPLEITKQIKSVLFKKA